MFLIGFLFVSPVGFAAGSTAMGRAHIWITRGRRLLPLWGVLSLGIGDAAGAIVVTWFGKTQWQPRSPNPKTLQGSAAMWISLMVSCLVLEYAVSNDDLLMEEKAQYCPLSTVFGMKTVQFYIDFSIN